jgi:RNA polymerase sigma-70 factor, ECF subfamily
MNGQLLPHPADGMPLGSRPLRCQLREMSDDRLLLTFASGDERAFEVLYARHEAIVINLVYRFFGGGHPDTEDFCAEIRLKAWLGLNRFERRSRFSTWLYRIAYNHCIGIIRRRKHQFVDVTTLEIEDPHEPIEETLQNEELRAQLPTALDELPKDLRDVVMLRLVQGLREKETAQALGIPEGTVKSRKSRALQRLREILICRGVL